MKNKRINIKEKKFRILLENWSRYRSEEISPAGRLVTLSDFHIHSGHAPIYNKTILVTEKHMAEILFFGRFLLRLSVPDHSRVISKASFCWAHSN